MTAFLTQTAAPTTATAAPSSADARALRALDLLLAGGLLAASALPFALAAALGRLQHSPAQGLRGEIFDRLKLRLPRGRGSRSGLAARLGRGLSALGAEQWPVLLHILKGEMAFVGPRVRPAGEALAAATLSVRPGLVNPWFIRKRTAVAFDTEAEADTQYLEQRSLRHDLGLLLRGAMVALLPAAPAAVPGRVRVGDVAFDNVDMQEAIARLGDMLDGASPQQVSFVNPACVNIAASHRGYRRVLARAELVLPDGIGIKIGSDLLGTPLKQNVNGTDLFPRLCDLLQDRKASLFLLGGQPGVAERVAAQVASGWPGVRIAGVRDGFFNVAEEGGVAAAVRGSGADVLLVARGVPSQDLFVDRYLPQLGVKVAMGVGGLFDFVSGRISRAPMWMRETGLEWVYRLMQEPGRMWRRYLVGNLTFLARVGLQRLGLRQPNPDVQPTPRLAPLPDASQRRAMLFATTRAGADLPVAPDHPAALLPVGCQTLIEHAMDSLAGAAVVEVHVVVSDQPEALRAALGDGSRWGIRLHWHLAQDPNRPYAALRSLAEADGGALLVGHAELCLPVAALQALLQAPGALMHAVAENGPVWTGWAQVDTARLQALSPDADRKGLLRTLSQSGSPALLCAADDTLAAPDAAHLLQAPFAGLARGAALQAPAAWRHEAWGAISPLARLHPGATVVGPALIGPGCMVEAGAFVGPGVVLSRNVVVSAGTRLEHTTVLPDTYLGANLDLAHAVVNGARVRHVRLGVESTLAAQDALLLPLTASASRRRASAFGRVLAVSLLLPAAPLLAVHLAQCRWSRRPRAWARQWVVVARHPASGALSLGALRSPRVGSASPATKLLSLFAGLVDVAAGRRVWFGARPRSRSQWYALRADWQGILADVPVGLFHAPAWADQAANSEEAGAAADVFWALQTSWQRFKTLPSSLVALLRQSSLAEPRLSPTAASSA